MAYKNNKNAFISAYFNVIIQKYNKEML